MSKYCPSVFKTERFKTREVFVGNVGIGKDNPIRIQSMTTSDTRDAVKTADQIMKLADYGCEIVRVTVQGMKEAYSCEEIKSILLQKGYTVPIVADIHFYPKAALTVADFVDKVRINPGNFIDKRASFKVLEYTDQEYAAELMRLEEKFTPLVERCKKRDIAIRIGTNHGSLSDRIMNRFGDSPVGMVEAAFEFTAVCRKLNFHNIIYSMKASNTQVMIQAYRLLVQKMMQLGLDYPIHLGVTEAGIGDDGRIKSAVGIGSLLLDGIGDTIRVSLTEDPWFEIDPCKRLVSLYNQYRNQTPRNYFEEKERSPIHLIKKPVNIRNKPFHENGSVLVKINENDLLSDSIYQDLGFETQFNQPVKTLSSIDSLVFTGPLDNPKALQRIEKLKELNIGVFSKNPLISTHTYLHLQEENNDFKTLSYEHADAIFLELKKDKVHFAREVVDFLKEKKIALPVILDVHYSLSMEDLCIHLGAECGSILCDGLADGILISASNMTLFKKRELSFNLLQACRMRSFKTEFISCPSCGRTLFDLQEVTQQIQERTAHLPGVKIAIMGCIVNGPGEMADADFGYVGSKPGKIDLYVGKNCVEKDIDHEHAVGRLVGLLKKHGRWAEPQMPVQIKG